MAISLKNVDDRLKTLENLKDHQILETKVGENGYIKFGNGLLIQWWVHRANIHGGWTTTTYPTSFKSKPWIIRGYLMGNNVSDSYSDNMSIRFNSATTTSVQVYQAGASYSTYLSSFLAIGI